MAVKKYKTLLQWKAPEFRHYPKNFAWYVTLFILAILLVGYELYRRDWFGGVSLGIIAGFVYAYSKQHPKLVTIKISNLGVHINDFTVPYSHIRHFWIVSNDKFHSLNLETTAYINHIITIELEDQDTEDVRGILSKALPENSELEETLAQRISHRFKF